MLPLDYPQSSHECTKRKGFPPETNTAKQDVTIMELKSLGTFCCSLGIKRSERLSEKIRAVKYSRYQCHWQFAYWLVWVQSLYSFESSFAFKLN